MATDRATGECAVVLRTFNEAEGLEVLLPALAAQRPDPPRVIAVDSGSTDDTLRILEDADVRTIRLAREQFTYGRTLNLGLAEVTEEFAALISAHAVPRSRYWIADLVAPMRDDASVAAVSGAINGQIPYLKHARTDVILASPEQYLANPICGLVNANAAIRMSAWRTHPFDEETIACEDRQWTLDVLRAGHKVCLSTGGDVWHHHETDTPRALYRRGHREHLALYGMLPRQSCLRFLVDVFGRPLVWFGRGVRNWVGYVAWRLGQLCGHAAGRHARKRH